MTNDADKGKQFEEEGWVHKVPEKEFDSNLDRTKETFMEAKERFAEASTSGSQYKMQEIIAPVEVDSIVLTTFLETYVKLFCNSKVVEGL